MPGFLTRRAFVRGRVSAAYWSPRRSCGSSRPWPAPPTPRQLFGMAECDKVAAGQLIKLLSEPLANNASLELEREETIVRALHARQDLGHSTTPSGEPTLFEEFTLERPISGNAHHLGN
jgi:hypothetical protein